MCRQPALLGETPNVLSKLQARAIMNPNMIQEADRPLFNNINEVYNAHQ